MKMIALLLFEGVKSARKGSQGQSNSQSSQTPIIGAMVGNKMDYRIGSSESNPSSGDSRAEVQLEDAQRMATDLALSFFEASAVHIITRKGL